MQDELIKILRSIGSAHPHYTVKEINLGQLPHAALSYALAGEDVALRRLFKRRFLDGLKGTYVDIGCAAPVSISNTYLFYCMGWRGLCIDANGNYAGKWKSIRAEDIFVHAAVSERPGEAAFYLHKENRGMSKTSDTPLSADWEAVPLKVPRRRLDALLAEHIGDKDIQFMTIDVEGAELDVLRSNDWAKWPPEVILLECADFDFLQPTASPPVSFLLGQGYALHLRVGGNVILCRRDLRL